VPGRVGEHLNPRIDAAECRRLLLERLHARRQPVKLPQREGHLLVHTNDRLVQGGKLRPPARELRKRMRQRLALGACFGDERLEVIRLLLELAAAGESFYGI
jgi:hypothetical protein